MPVIFAFLLAHRVLAALVPRLVDRLSLTHGLPQVKAVSEPAQARVPDELKVKHPPHHFQLTDPEGGLAALGSALFHM